MKKKIPRRAFLKKTLQFGLVAAVSGTGLHFYAHQIETRLLQITNHTIKHPLIPSGFDGVKIVQFSDTHLGFQYSIKQFIKLAETINNLQPDIILFTGDLMDEPNKYSHHNQISQVLSQLKAPLGKFCIFGNHDHGGYGSNIYHSIMTQANFIILKNEAKQVKLLDGSFINIIGIDDAMLGKPRLEMAITDVPQDSFKILLSHEPELAKEAFTYGVHLQLSGHSHGGQIKIPFLGALVTPPFADKYKEGFYHITNSSHSLILYVNRGIGTTRLPFRFLAQPELTVFKLAVEFRSNQKR